MKRQILFVDDEPKVLHGLKRMLRIFRHEWELAFAENGREALEIMEKQSFEVVVSDMRMPVMNGVQLLGQIKKRYPKVVRIILSGESDQGKIMEAVRISHQFLSKPCDPAVLKSAISRTCNLFDLLNSNTIKRAVSGMESLPSMPAIYSEIMDEFQSRDVSIQRIGRIISKDMAMTTKILQLVNSAFFCLPRHVSSPMQAVVLLGLDIIKSLALTINVFKQFDQKKIPAFFFEHLWDHSLITGRIAKDIASEENKEKTSIDQAFLAGLLHDVGKLALASSFSEQYRDVIALTRKGDVSYCDCETEIFGITHAEVGAYMMGLWGLPVPLVEAIAFHHSPQTCGDKQFSPLTAVHIANALGGDEPCSEESDLQLDVDYMSVLDMTDRFPVWMSISQNALKGAVTVGE